MNVQGALTIVHLVGAKYSAELLGLVSGVGAIAARDYGRGVTDLLQSSAIVFGSISVIGLRKGVEKVHHAVTYDATQEH